MGRFGAFLHGIRVLCGILVAICSTSACGGGGSGAAPGNSALVSAPAAAVPAVASTSAASGSAVSTNGQRGSFVGAFFRPEGPPPFGVFSVSNPGVLPNPYPTPGSALLGSSGYCTRIAANGYSIESGNVVDATKLNDTVSLGVRWVRMPAPQFTDDLSHVYGAGHYQFGDLDSAQCSTLAEHGIKPVIGLEAGPVQYSATIGQLPAVQDAQYQSAADFGSWCGSVAAHERSAFPTVTQFSLPGNEVNSNPQLFPGGNPQIAAFSTACYAAIKAANPSAFVYGFELNMDGNLNAPAFVRQMAALGCGVGTCYDGLAIHFSMRYPTPSAATPCYPNPGADYGMQCLTDMQNATGSAVHILVSETVYPVPGYVPDEATKALAIVAELTAMAGNSNIDGVNYANVDECALYPSGFFFDGCLISAAGQVLPAYTALQKLALANYQ